MGEVNLHPEYPDREQLDSAEAWLHYADALLAQAEGSGLQRSVQMQQVAMALMQAQRHGADETTIRRLLLTRATLELADQVQDLGLEDGAIRLRQLAGK
jgi:hypothetical protein